MARVFLRQPAVWRIAEFIWARNGVLHLYHPAVWPSEESVKCVNDEAGTGRRR